MIDCANVQGYIPRYFASNQGLLAVVLAHLHKTVDLLRFAGPCSPKYVPICWALQREVS